MFLNSKSVKEIKSKVKDQWEADVPDYVFMQKEDDLFITTREIDRLPLDRLRINSIGLYFAEYRNNELRLSIEGSQIIGETAKKNIIELDNNEIELWIRGRDIDLSGEDSKRPASGFLIIKHNSDFYGCGKVKEGRLLNFYPKSRRINSTLPEMA